MKNKNHSLLNLLLAILIIGFIAVLSAVMFNGARMKARDAVRLEDIGTIKAALISYFHDSPIGYPYSSGECLKPDSGVGAELKAAGELSSVPLDPLWPKVVPVQVNGLPDAGQVNFCYFYYSDASDQFKISFFLESDSKAGRAGINTVRP